MVKSFLSRAWLKEVTRLEATAAGSAADTDLVAEGNLATWILTDPGAGLMCEGIAGSTAVAAITGMIGSTKADDDSRGFKFE